MVRCGKLWIVAQLEAFYCGSEKMMMINDERLDEMFSVETENSVTVESLKVSPKITPQAILSPSRQQLSVMLLGGEQPALRSLLGYLRTRAKVILAEDLPSALEKLSRQQVDVVFSAACFHCGSWTEAVETIGFLYPDLPVVVVNEAAQQQSLLDLAEPRWKDRVAIPNSGSEYLQAGVSVMKVVHGDERIKKFLEDLKANAGAQVYGKSSQIVEAVAKGQVALGIVNHYYMYRHLATAPDAPIALLVPDQQEGKMGAILNVAGIGITAQTKHLEAAKRLVSFLASEAGQKQFADVNKEYPLRADVAADPALPDRKQLRTAAVPLTRLSELREPAMALIESAGLR